MTSESSTRRNADATLNATLTAAQLNSTSVWSAAVNAEISRAKEAEASEGSIRSTAVEKLNVDVASESSTRRNADATLNATLTALFYSLPRDFSLNPFFCSNYSSALALNGDVVYVLFFPYIGKVVL